eukprot:763052-Hanusia_phi.AAC.1
MSSSVIDISLQTQLNKTMEHAHTCTQHRRICIKRCGCAAEASHHAQCSCSSTTRHHMAKLPLSP